MEDSTKEVCVAEAVKTAIWGFLPFYVTYIQAATQFIAGAPEGPVDTGLLDGHRDRLDGVVHLPRNGGEHEVLE